jgi:hypothetical protein
LAQKETMNLSKNILAIIICVFALSLTAQEKRKEIEKKFYYKDTAFEFNGARYEISKVLANESSFKFRVNVTNMTNDFIVVTPYDVFSFATDPKIKRASSSAKTAVIAPRYTKAFTLKFDGPDYRMPAINIDFTKIQNTGKADATYPIPDMNIFTDNFKQTGPVKVTVDNNKKEDKSGYRIIVVLEYNGNKFLSFFQNNIVLKTKDGGSYTNTGKKNSDFHYEMGKPSERDFLFFPVSENKINAKNEPTLTFKDVFKEYSLVSSVGPKIKLRQGTIEDFNGANKKSEIDDADTDK